MKQFVLTPAMGKRLIGKGMARHPAIREVLRNGTLVIVAGTTNGYVAEEVLSAGDQGEGFTRRGFYRGVVNPPDYQPDEPADPEAVAARVEGDVVLVRGSYRRGKTIFDVAEGLGRGDVICKGANALDLASRQAGVLIGHPQAGTAGAAIAAAAGRHVRLIVPVGLEKRVCEPIGALAAAVSHPQTQGPGMLPLCGEVFTELDAIAALTGAEARLLAGGGVNGAEGAVWIGVAGAPAQVQAAEDLIASVAGEPPCRP